VKQTPTYTRREIKTADDHGTSLTTTLWGSIVDKTVQNQIAIGARVKIENVETCLWNEKIQLRSTSDTDIQVCELK
jgi:hypothetical protein